MVAAEVAAKERKDAEKKKTAAVEDGDTVFDRTPVADGTDAISAPQRSLVHLKRQRPAPGKRSKR